MELNNEEMMNVKGGAISFNISVILFPLVCRNMFPPLLDSYLSKCFIYILNAYYI